jgi:hypothetical protein
VTEFIDAVGHATPAVAATGLGVAALKTIVGPTANVFGNTVAEFVEYRLRNWLGIAKAAEQVLGEDPPQGQVHARVVHRVLEEATYLDDEVMQQYAGGLLVASRTPEGRDDRAAYYINLLSSLTANQVRLHHAIYEALARHPRPPDHDIGHNDRAHELSVRVPITTATTPIDVAPGTRAVDAVSEAVIGLFRDGLIGHGVAVGTPAELAPMGVSSVEPMMVVVPNALGALLFLWGRGVRTANADDLGRVPMPPLSPPGPAFVHVEVGPWTSPPATVEHVRLEHKRADQQRRIDEFLSGG